MKLIINGAGGRMGQTLLSLIASSDKYDLAASCSMEFDTDRENNIYKNIAEFDGEADCIIDFSNHLATKDVTEYAVKRNIPLVVATTGQSAEELSMIKEASKEIPLFYSQNMSLGVAVLSCLAKITAKAFPDADIEIIEKHHNQKLDVPSGTAILLADAIKSVKDDCEYNIGRHEYGKRKKNEIGIHAIRMGGEVGTHEIIFAMGSQVLTLKHEAENRSLFAEGALSAADFLVKQEAGFYNMDNILD
ncbi:MAG: 4-hydroxy-tetrahydrodipicolinate reductase [Clostridia bacterium]|nr:4-hydroxy-tetrahydrodipicolinate reductase [Clostridia bacterium]MBQ1967484.1 4-hydroxy-tetrahydrodipicolinate reductase [Clostridia bacterium]MBQ1996194.1 4-hydroxy-tetrahydrodipicolinate reductase [Clostridia bacterium]